MGKPKHISKKDLVFSAKKQLVLKGQGNVTFKNVAEAVGVTQGVVYYHFKTKEQLLVALLQDYMESNRMKIEEQDMGSSPYMQDIIRYISEENYKAQRSAEEHQLLFELVALSLHHRKLKTIMGQAISEKVDNLTSLAGGNRLAGRILAAVMDGLALQNLTDPSFKKDETYNYLKKVVEILISKEKAE